MYLAAQKNIAIKRGQSNRLWIYWNKIFLYKLIGLIVLLLIATVGIFLGLVIVINADQLMSIVWTKSKIGLVILVAIIFSIISMNSTVYIMSLYIMMPLSLIGLYFIVSLLLKKRGTKHPK